LPAEKSKDETKRKRKEEKFEKEAVKKEVISSIVREQAEKDKAMSKLLKAENLVQKGQQ
jgi:hypothetical protein